MKFTLTVHLVGAQLQIESERLDDLAGGYVAANQLATAGVLPPSYPTLEMPQGVDAGVVRPATEAVAAEETRSDVEPAATPQPEIPPTRETDKPGKTRKARTQAAQAPAPEPEPEPEGFAEMPVTRAEATAALRDLMEDKGEPAVKKVLEQLGVARFGLYVRDEGRYQPVLDAIAKVGAA